MAFRAPPAPRPRNLSCAQGAGRRRGRLRPLPAKLRPVFRDEDELAGAAELGPKLQSALADAAALLGVICACPAPRNPPGSTRRSAPSRRCIPTARRSP
ncbi:hypothetical protein AB5I41_12240 [Sphingomonas sp. MMS24-JH45]